jgi:cell division septation protein DedD
MQIDNQRGGIISNMIMIPVGVALMIGFFFLGYYVGKYQPKSGKQDEIIVPLPEVVSKNLPKKDDFTFYKILSDKENKTVSIDLKPKTDLDDTAAKKSADKEPAREKGDQAKKDEKKQTRTEKNSPAANKGSEPKQQAEKKDVAGKQAQNQKIRYSLQIASYQEKAMAEEDVKNMKKKGYAAFIVLSELEGKGTWYRVRVGSFSSKPAAEKLQKELKTKAGVTAFITSE